jgi:hypothetical protein
MTAISRALGVAVTTQRPSQAVSPMQVDTYFSVFAARLRDPAPRIGNTSAAGGNDQGDNNNDQGRPPHSKNKP